MVGKPMTYPTRYGDVPSPAALKRLDDDTTLLEADAVNSYGFIEREFDIDSHEQTMEEVRGIH